MEEATGIYEKCNKCDNPILTISYFVGSGGKRIYFQCFKKEVERYE